MCLFPWFDYGNDISDFENLHFLVGQLIFSIFGGLEIWPWLRAGACRARRAEMAGRAGAEQGPGRAQPWRAPLGEWCALWAHADGSVDGGALGGVK